jgi:CrcB protein
MSQKLLPYLLVGLGGFVGANARFVVARWVGGLVEARFPLGTFLINVGGSFCLGLLGALLTQKAFPDADALRLALGVGFLGAFTTFSTFEFENHALLEDGLWLTALTNIFLSLFAGLVAVRLGVVAARSWF